MKSNFIVEKEVFVKRLDTCKSCENFNKYIGTCKLCGCIMKIKTKFPNMKCPDNRWEK